jgi:hypothetical protein
MIQNTLEELEDENKFSSNTTRKAACHHSKNTSMVQPRDYLFFDCFALLVTEIPYQP